MKIISLFKALMLGSVMALGWSVPAFAGDVGDRLSALLTSHDSIRAAAADVEAARANEGVARGGYFPTASVTGNLGNERIRTSASNTNTSMAAREVDLNLSQTLYDFGAVSAVVDGARLAVVQAETVLKQTEQAVLLAALSAEFNLGSAKRVLDFQAQSEANIKRQADLEDARVKRGSGFSTDVLQAKTQLACKTTALHKSVSL